MLENGKEKPNGVLGSYVCVCTHHTQLWSTTYMCVAHTKLYSSCCLTSNTGFVVSTILQLLACCTTVDAIRGRNTILFKPSWILLCHYVFAKQQRLPCVPVQVAVSINFCNRLLSRSSIWVLRRVQQRVPVQH